MSSTIDNSVATTTKNAQPGPYLLKLNPGIYFKISEMTYLEQYPHNMSKYVKNNKKKTLFTSKLDLNLRKKLVKCYIWSMAFYGADTWTLRAAD
jgi:hypothetical protein